MPDHHHHPSRSCGSGTGQEISESVRARLAASGLQLYACFSLAELIRLGVPGLELLCADLAGDADGTQGPSLVLVGNQGPALWQACQQSPFRNAEDPVDEFSYAVVYETLREYYPAIALRVLYPLLGRPGQPETCAIPLQKLGQLAGWHQRSPLGIGINAHAGLWFAYRVLVLVEADWRPTPVPPAVPPTGPDICASCASQACVSACPASVLAVGEAPDLRACAGYRLTVDSHCAATCVARYACPVATGQQYSAAQTAHHYTRVLAALRCWVGPETL